MHVYVTTESTSCVTEQYANEIVMLLLRDCLAAQDVTVTDAADADMAIMIASRLHGTGFEAYHQVTPDWDCYMASYRLACQMQTQVQRYQLVYKRKPKAGYAIPWLHEMTIPAVVCEYYLNDKMNSEKLNMQAKAYMKAIQEWRK